MAGGGRLVGGQGLDCPGIGLGGGLEHLDGLGEVVDGGAEVVTHGRSDARRGDAQCCRGKTRRYASLCIRENPGCLFIATNRDPTGHMTSSQEWPGAGTMVAAVSCSVQKEPIVVGKPSSFLMDFLLKSFNLETSRMCMVGDRLDTDILFGQNTGCKTLLVLSGVTTLPELQDASNNIHPDLYTNNVYDLVGLLQQ
ncbi:hypothetical protein GUJ93_ZPchr0002g23944 [Zizania palustris]|uniref:Phosphoglycolate phosphatase n=1 Tax=Zizania palustris TaxID=103762 RepID=A0A8J5SIV3_ZIZPA|nr:hypothetical protein GUJ93_ZPchr0002g23944 [Zizania palustris]